MLGTDWMSSPASAASPVRVTLIVNRAMPVAVEGVARGTVVLPPHAAMPRALHAETAATNARDRISRRATARTPHSGPTGVI